MASVDDLTFTLSSDGTYYSVKATATTIAGDLEIPSEYSGLPVKKIDNAGFKSCASLTSVVVPESITALPDSAFQDCTGITALTLPSGLTSLGANSVRNCKKLTSISLPAGLTSIGSYAFSSCTSLTSISLPAGLTSIGSYAFSSCTSLTSISLPAGLTSIGSYAFRNMTKLTSFKFEGDKVAEPTDVFAGTTNLKEVHVNAFATGYGDTWGGKSVVVDNPVYLGGTRISKAYFGENRVRKWMPAEEAVAASADEPVAANLISDDVSLPTDTTNTASSDSSDDDVTVIV